MPKAKISKEERLRQEREAFLRKHGVIKRIRKLNRSWNMPDLSVDVSGVAEISNTIPGSCFKKSIDDYKWKRNREESKQTSEEIERKKLKIAPTANKMAYQYITDDTNPETLGRKL